MTATDIDVRLMNAAYEARFGAYCPYSNFRVGAAILCDNDTIITGANVENISYGLSMCAERNAVFHAVYMGYRKFHSVAICSDQRTDFITPCGACRQVLAEFGQSCDILLMKSDVTRSWKKTTLAELLPDAKGINVKLPFSDYEQTGY